MAEMEVEHANVDVEKKGSVQNEPMEENATDIIKAGKPHSSVMAPALLFQESVFVSLHPLVIMNISEHWTRIKAQEGSAQQVIGALIGKQKGRNVEIMNSFELVFTLITETGDIIIDRQYYMQKESQFKQVFPELDFLGWYTTGDTPNESDIQVHRQICEINESPVFLKFNPLNRSTRLPISMYESVIDLVDGEATVLFVEISYTLVTEEAERIGLDHCAKLTSPQQGGNASNSVVAEHLRCQHNAIKMLRDRVKLILDYVKETQSGAVDWNHEVIREAYNLCHQLPLLNTSKFNEKFYNQCNDVALMTYLGMLTKGSNSMNQFVNKFNILYERQGVNRRMRSLFF